MVMMSGAPSPRPARLMVHDAELPVTVPSNEMSPPRPAIVPISLAPSCLNVIVCGPPPRPCPPPPPLPPPPPPAGGAMGAIVIVHVPETFAGACGMALTATTESSSAHAQNAASHTVVFFILESPQISLHA